MSEARVDAILDRSGGTNTTINGVLIRPGIIDEENRIINGAFDFWQRGTNFPSPGYCADRWLHSFVGGASTVSRQSFTLGDIFGSNDPTFFLRQSVSGQTLASHRAQILQYIEGVRTYAGQTITVLGWARRSSGSGNIVLECGQGFGTGGSPSTAVLGLNITTISLTTSWVPFAVTVNVPSITGKTLGTNGDDYFFINFWLSAGSDFNSRSNSLGLQTIGVDLWGIHIRRGTHLAAAAQNYVQPELGPELARCQRYYEKSYNIDTTPGTATNTAAWEAYFPVATANVNILNVAFKQTKRGAPSITVYSPASGSAGNIRDATSALDRAATVRLTGTGSFSVTSAATANAIHNIHWVADSELL